MKPIQMMIVGAAKCGTTSLKDYLGQHPAIGTHWQREMRFFASEQEYAKGYSSIFSYYFPQDDAPATVLLAKSVSILYTPVAMTRLHAHNPQVQVVVILRNPVDRAYSEYWYARRRGWEDQPTFEQALAADPRRFDDEAQAFRCAYLQRSNYVEYVEQLYSVFRRAQVQVLLLDELRREPAQLCQRLFRLLEGVDPTFVPSVDYRRNSAALPRSRSVLRFTESAARIPALKRVLHTLLSPAVVERVKAGIQELNESDFSIPPMQAETRAWLEEQFEPANARLSEITGCDLTQWNRQVA